MRFKGRQPFQNSAFLIGYQYHSQPTKTVCLSALSDSSNLAHRFRCRNPFLERVGGVEARHPADLARVEDGTIQSPCHIGVTQQCCPIIKFTSILLSPPQCPPQPQPARAQDQILTPETTSNYRKNSNTRAVFYIVVIASSSKVLCISFPLRLS